MKYYLLRLLYTFLHKLYDYNISREKLVGYYTRHPLPHNVKNEELSERINKLCDEIKEA